MGPYSGPSIGEVIIDNYEDSIMHFTKITHSLFGDLFKDEDPITLEKVFVQTDHGDSGPTVVGTPRLCVFWFACEKETDDCELLNVN